ncbi:hypothetical protein ScPMuIL_008400 [Solemya velum]
MDVLRHSSYMFRSQLLRCILPRETQSFSTVEPEPNIHRPTKACQCYQERQTLHYWKQRRLGTHSAFVGSLFSPLMYKCHHTGSPYDMGYAHGELMKKNVSAMIDRLWDYIEKEATDAINKSLPGFHPWFLKDVIDYGLDVALDLERLATEKHTGSYIFEEAKGLADASGVDYKKRILFDVRSLGDSLPVPGSLLQLRSLDFIVDGPLQDYPQVTVYHPTSATNGHAFANFGWTGWIASITGISTQMAISEIGVSYPDESFGKESRFGVPFTYLLRDILQFDETLDDAVNRISNSARTCDLILGVGDGKLGEFRGVEYSASVSNFFDDQNLQPKADWHPRINNVVYWGMDWLCKSYSAVFARQLQKYHGNITADNVIRDMVSIIQSGDLQAAIYDLKNSVAYLANARASHASGPGSAYDRQFIRLDMKTLFNEEAPRRTGLYP